MQRKGEVEDQEDPEIAARLKRETLLEDLRFMFRTPQGKRIIQHIVSECNILGSSYASGNAIGMAYNEGRRSVGISFLADIKEAEPDKSKSIEII